MFTTDVVLLDALLLALGFLAHVLKKAGTEKINVFTYLSVNSARTYTALSGAIVAFVSLLLLYPDASPMEFFMIGYLADSVGNRTPTPSEVERAKRKKDTTP